MRDGHGTCIATELKSDLLLLLCNVFLTVKLNA